MADSLSFHAYLTQLYDYNDWANQHYLSVAAGLPPEQLFHDYAQSWGSIYGVLEHILAAEWLWLQRCKGNSPMSYPSKAGNQTAEALQRRYNELEGDLHSFLAAQTDQSLLQEIHYTNTKGIPYHLKLWQILAHAANHGTHHRGELAAMFAILGIPHPEEDWFLYFLERSGQRKA
jgi:uncharacterized damage-inducible protein DinB